MGGFQLGGQVSKTTQNNATSVDPGTSAYVDGIRNSAFNAGTAGPGPLLNGAAAYGTAAQAAGNLGFGALSGDPRATGQLMNPYLSNVVDANNADWAHTNAATASQINDEATRAGAFGGSRHGVAEGVALSGNNLQQQNQLAQLRYQGYNDAMSRASALAGYGFQGANLNSNLGFGGVGNPDLWLLQMLRQGYTGPTGQTSSGATTNSNFGLGYGK